MAKKSDIAELLEERETQGKPQPEAPNPREPSAEELAVLKKLDTLRYNDRTEEKVGALLGSQEQQVLQRLIKKGFVELFSKGGGVAKYSIPKNIYDRFLMRKRQEAPASQPVQQRKAPVQTFRQSREQAEAGADQYIKALQENGFAVVPTEAEAQNLSLAVEESIRRGLILGTRAFNKRFYIATRSFINKNSPGILKAIESRSLDADEIARLTGIAEDGVRAVLYILAESGDVTEVRRDVFRQA